MASFFSGYGHRINTIGWCCGYPTRQNPYWKGRLVFLLQGMGRSTPHRSAGKVGSSFIPAFPLYSYSFELSLTFFACLHKVICAFLFIVATLLTSRFGYGFLWSVYGLSPIVGIPTLSIMCGLERDTPIPIMVLTLRYGQLVGMAGKKGAQQELLLLALIETSTYLQETTTQGQANTRIENTVNTRRGTDLTGIGGASAIGWATIL